MLPKNLDPKNPKTTSSLLASTGCRLLALISFPDDNNNVESSSKLRTPHNLNWDDCPKPWPVINCMGRVSMCQMALVTYSLCSLNRYLHPRSSPLWTGNLACHALACWKIQIEKWLHHIRARLRFHFLPGSFLVVVSDFRHAVGFLEDHSLLDMRWVRIDDSFG